MSWWGRLPWRFVVRRIARAHGFLDPIALLARIHQFAQPSEVAEPIELLRAGVAFHARGLINSRVIQHNRDWVWPYWVERQFDPEDVAFVPRAFTITHINLTNRNWTAIGLPDFDELPIVDPRGLLTPFFDEWSLDSWIVADDGRMILPSRAASAVQRLDLADGVSIDTDTETDGLSLSTRAEMELDGNVPVCRLRTVARSPVPGWMVIGVRPYNPEGIAFVHHAEISDDRRVWTIDGKRRIELGHAAERHHISNYRMGDVFLHLHDAEDQRHGSCEVGLATAAALYRLQPDRERDIEVTIPLLQDRTTPAAASTAWPPALEEHCRLEVPDSRFQLLWDAAVRTLILHSPGDVYPGPYTYKRFWFRDAAFIINGMLSVGLVRRARRTLDRFAGRQTAFGYFHSQDGEWDSNGEALWAYARYCELTGEPPPPAWRGPVYQGARWIVRKRLPDDGGPHSGLLPAGFSAEHLGPNDYYYWDDFWGIAGLRAAAGMAEGYGDEREASEFEQAAADFVAAVDRSIAAVAPRLGRPAIPAAPTRRLDAGAVGSLAIGYPLALCGPTDPRLLDTVAYLQESCFFKGGFFQDMIHSGINAYLTLHVAQVLLRAGDRRCLELMATVARLASPTGQWPEAIHPHTLGGCMGDGQHVWAAAEWLLMQRNCLVREEGDRLILASGVPRQWLHLGDRVALGPAPTAFGPVSLVIETRRDRIAVSWQAQWRRAPACVEVRLPGFAPVVTDPGQGVVEFVREAAT